MGIHSGVTEFVFFVFFLGGRGPDLHLGGGQEDGIAMKDAQSKVKWEVGGGNGGHGVNGGGGACSPGPHIVTPLLYMQER